jgi:hypothetical protein
MEGTRCGSSSRIPALQAQDPDFKHQSTHKKKKKKEKEKKREILGFTIKEYLQINKSKPTKIGKR